MHPKKIYFEVPTHSSLNGYTETLVEALTKENEARYFKSRVSTIY